MVLVGEQILTTISGVVDGNSVAAEIGTGSGEVSYVRTPEGEWVTGADGEWVEPDGEPPGSGSLSSTRGTRRSPSRWCESRIAPIRPV